MNRHKFMRKIAIFFLRTGNGEGLIARFIDPVKDALDGTVYLFAIKGLFDISVPLWILPLLIAIKKGLAWTLGYLNERIGFWKAENYYSAWELNPYNQEVMRKLDRLLEAHK